MTNDKFRDAVEFHFGDRTDIYTKTILGKLMGKRGFFNASRKKKETQTEYIRRANRQQKSLLDFAWSVLKEKEIEEKSIAKEYRTFSIETVVKKKGKGYRKRKLMRDTKTGRIIGWT